MKSANGTKKFWEALRAHLKTIGAAAIEKITAIKANTITSFILGRSKGLTEESISELRRVGLIPAEIEAGDHQPLSNYIGEVKSVSAAAAEKGYSPATIRAWCKSGKLDYVKKGSRYLVAINEKFAAIPESEKAALRKRIVELEAENAQLRHQVETLQLEFSFEQPPAPDSDANLVAVDEAIVAQTQCQGCDKKAQCDCLVSDERPIYDEKPNLFVCKMADKCENSKTCAVGQPHTIDTNKAMINTGWCYDYRNTDENGFKHTSTQNAFLVEAQGSAESTHAL